ncbi:MAG: hypothetical protein ACI965_000914 [Paraglaciecola sp.]|jgi:hypothetical protein
MSLVHFQFNQLFTLFLVLLTAVSISACGGGGNDATPQSISAVVAASTSPPPSVPESQDYTPEPLKLRAEAETSQDLFVEANFAFDSYRKVIFDIDATDVNSLPLSDVMLAISVINKEIVQHDDPRLQQKSLISMAKTDKNGQIYLSLELPQTATKVLLELNAVGMQNDVIISIDDGGQVLHHFTQQH